MSRPLILLFAAVSLFGASCTYYDDAPPYEGARYERYGSGYNTRYGYEDPWEVGYTERRSPSYSTFGSFGPGYRTPHGGYRHGSSCGCSSCRSKYHSSSNHGHSHGSSCGCSSCRSKYKSSSSSRNKSSSSQKHSSSSSRSNKSSSNKSSSNKSSGNKSSGSSRAKEWQKDKGGNPRAARR